MSDKTPETPDEQPLVHGAEQIQAQMTEEDEKGYRGVRANPIAEQEYSILSGPHGPTVLDEQAAMAKEATPNV